MNLEIYDDNNVFAKIIRGELPANKIYEDDKILIFYDIRKEANFHALAIPKQKCRDYQEFLLQNNAQEISYFFKKIAEVIKQKGINHFKLITNCGPESGQLIFHFHVHILSSQEV